MRTSTKVAGALTTLGIAASVTGRMLGFDHGAGAIVFALGAALLIAGLIAFEWGERV